MTDDKYIMKMARDLLIDVRTAFKLENSDEWLKEFKKTLTNILNKVYEDGFQDGHAEGLDDAKSGKF